MSTQTKHMSGPWALTERISPRKGWWIKPPPVNGHSVPICAVENDANAHLIVAAPDLYEALQEARRELYESWHPTMSQEIFYSHPIIQQIDTALARARGET